MADALVTEPRVIPTRLEIVRAASLLAGISGDEGYSAVDSPSAKSVLGFERPTDRQTRSLWLILGRYGRQLSTLGVDYAALIPPPVPESPEDGRVPVQIHNGHEASLEVSVKEPKVVSLILAGTKEWVTVGFKFHPKLVAVVQKLANRRFDKEGKLGGVPKSWVIPRDPTSIEAAIGALEGVGPEVVVEKSPEVAEIIERGKRSYVESRAETAEISVPTKLPLYPYQNAGVKGIDDRKGRALIADEMGLGKTPEVLGWLVLRKETTLPALVVCKAMLKVNWVDEAKKFTDFKCLILAGHNSVGQLSKFGYDVAEMPKPGYELTIVNYDLFATESPKTWLKMLLNDDKERSLKEKLSKLETEKEEKEVEAVKARIKALEEEREYAAEELMRAGKQSLKLLEAAMKKYEDIASRNRIWPVLEKIKGDKNALSEDAPEYLRYFVNGRPLEEFMKPGWRTLVFDESHYVKEPEAQRTTVALKMASSVRHVMCLTGTPVLNRPKDLWSQTQIVDPDLFPSFFSYGKEFCGAFQKPIATYKCFSCNGSGIQTDDLGTKPKPANSNANCEACKACGGEGKIVKKAWVFTGVSNIDKLEKTLRSTIMIRRMKEQVQKELPEKTRIMKPFVIEEKEERSYKKKTLAPMERLAKLKKERDEWKAFLATMTEEERQKFIAEHAEKAARASRLSGLILDDIEKIKQEAVDSRFDESLSFILDAHDQEGKILVFASHHSTVDRLLAALVKEGIRAAVIDGRVGAGKRVEIKKAFQEGDLEILICGIRAAAEGLTLTAAHIVVMMEMDWHPGIHSQAEDRVHRIGQSMPVTIYYLLAMGTVEEDIAKMVDAKREMMNAIMGEGERTLSEEGILDSVLDNILRKTG